MTCVILPSIICAQFHTRTLRSRSKIDLSCDFRSVCSSVISFATAFQSDFCANLASEWIRAKLSQPYGTATAVRCLYRCSLHVHCLLLAVCLRSRDRHRYGYVWSRRWRISGVHTCHIAKVLHVRASRDCIIACCCRASTKDWDRNVTREDNITTHPLSGTLMQAHPPPPPHP